jgi:hypothetical protein
VYIHVFKTRKRIVTFDKICMNMCMSKIYILSVVMKLVYLCSGQCRNGIPNFKLYGNLNSALKAGLYFKDLSTADMWSCIQFCCSYPLCRSVDLNRKQKKCRLNVRSSVEEPGLLISSENTHHIDKADFPQVSRKEFEVIHNDNLSVVPINKVF